MAKAIMQQGQLSRLTDMELIVHVDEARYLSPLIGELAKRLEAIIKSDARDDYNGQASCPVCEASLLVDFDDANKLFNIKPQRQ